MIARTLFIIIFYFALVYFGFIPWDPIMFLVYLVIASAIGFVLERRRPR